MQLFNYSLFVLSLGTLLLLSNGERKLHILNPKLAHEASTNPDQYWGNLTRIFERHIRGRSLEVFREWNKAVVRGELKDKVGKPCLDIIEHIIRHPLDQKWSAQIIDSMSSLPAGILSGTTTELGDFDQCLSIAGTFEQRDFVGKYCLATVNLPKAALFDPLNLNHSLLKHPWLGETIETIHNNDNFYSIASAVCFPSICHQDDIRTILMSYYEVLNMFDFNVTYCQSREEPSPYDNRIWIAAFILALPWLFVIPGTLYEYFNGCTSEVTSLSGQILVSFSLISNVRILFRMVDSKALTSAQFQFIHGIRTFAAFFVIIAHASGLVFVPYHMRVSVLSRHPTDMIDISRTPIAQPFYNGALVVLSFFLISGMFLTYWTASAKALKMNFTQYALLRWLRYTPPLIGMLCMTVCLEMMGTGPLFHHDLLWSQVEHCYDDWMSHLFYYSNYKDIDKTCGIQTWYISAEMQLHLIAFIFLAVYVRSRRLAFWIAVFFVALGMVLIVTMVATGLATIPLVHVTMYTQFSPPHSAVKYIFFVPTMNMIPYFTGVIIGQLLLENRIITLPKSTTRVFWAFSALILMGLPMASLPNSANLDLIPGDGTISNAVQFATAVLLWSLATGWVVYQCVINPHNGLARLLSAKFFQPISRLSFCLYLVHLMTIWYNAHQTRTTLSMATMNELYKAICLTMIQAFLLAFVLYLTFEAPSINLIKILMKRDIKQQAKKKMSEVEDDISDVNNNKAIEKMRLTNSGSTANGKSEPVEMKDKSNQTKQEKKSLSK